MGRKKAIFLCRLLSISKNTICISKLFVDFRIIACRTIERQPDNCIKRDCHWQWVWIRRVVWYAVKWNHSLLSSGRSGSDWRISWRRVVAPAGDWFFRLPGHAHSNQINVCLICPSTSIVIINLYWTPRGTYFGLTLSHDCKPLAMLRFLPRAIGFPLLRSVIARGQSSLC